MIEEVSVKQVYQKYNVSQNTKKTPVGVITVAVAKESFLRTQAKLEIDKPEEPQTVLTPYAASQQPALTTAWGPDSNRVIHQVQHITEVPGPFRTKVLYEGEFNVWGPGLFVADEPVEFDIDVAKAITVLSKLAIVNTRMTTKSYLLKVAALIDIPSTVKEFVPAITVRCILSADTWYGTMHCRLTVAYPRPSSTGSLICAIGVEENDSLVRRDCDSDSDLSEISLSEIDQ